MIEKIGYYGPEERPLYFEHCTQATGRALRTVQLNYKNLFQPENCHPWTSALENNNKQILKQYPNAVPGILGTGGTSHNDPDAEIVTSNIKLAKKAQKFQDMNRIERKSFRESARVVNALEEYNNKLCRVLSTSSFHEFEPKLYDADTVDLDQDEGTAGILQLSDIHFNELIELEHNRYDFTIASERLYKFVTKALNYFEAEDVSHVIIALTGDLMNSDRRLDELLNAATNRSKATFLAVDILQQVIHHVARYYPVTVACVSGNESRMSKEMGFCDDMMTDNYDFMIFNTLRYLFSSDEYNVDFVVGRDPTEMVINVCGKNILLTHGYNIKSKAEDGCIKVRGRYAVRGIKIDYIIFGHLHSCLIGDTFARSSSLCGSNTYSERSLNVESKASQNAFIVESEGSITGIKIDLQDTDPKLCYDIDSSLEAYNTKSADKAGKHNTVFKVVI